LALVVAPLVVARRAASTATDRCRASTSPVHAWCS